MVIHLHLRLCLSHSRLVQFFWFFILQDISIITEKRKRSFRDSVGSKGA